jgi:hypothetical protein
MLLVYPNLYPISLPKRFSRWGKLSLQNFTNLFLTISIIRIILLLNEGENKAASEYKPLLRTEKAENKPEHSESREAGLTEPDEGRRADQEIAGTDKSSIERAGKGRKK